MSRTSSSTPRGFPAAPSRAWKRWPASGSGATPPSSTSGPHRRSEAETAAAAGLAYYELPVSGNTLSLVLATRLQEILDEAPSGDVFIHCASGNRAAALWGLYLGLTEGLTPEEAVAAARRVGLTKDFLAARVREELGLAMPRPRYR